MHGNIDRMRRNTRDAEKQRQDEDEYKRCMETYSQDEDEYKRCIGT